MKNKIFISFSMLFILLMICSKVQAASASISASSTNATPGTKVTITTKINGASWQVSLSGAVSTTYSDSTSDAEDTIKTEKTTFTSNKEGTYKIFLSGNVTGSTDSSATPVSGSVTITVKEKTNNTVSNNNTDNNNTTKDNTSKPSTDATLKNLGIKPNDFSGFKKTQTNYSVTVPKSVEKISIYANPTDSKATVDGTGTKNLQIGKNTFNIKVTAEDKKTTKIYTLTITRKSEDEVSKDATLTNLGIRPKEYDFTGFKANITNYNLSVPNDVEKITIYATSNSNKATIVGVGAKTLKVGINKCEIKVTAEDKKTTKTYIINVTRKEQEEKKPEENEIDVKASADENSNDTIQGLKNIEVKDYKLSPDFSQNIYSYNLNVPSGTKKIEINTETTSNDYEVEIAGNEDFKDGDNIITILVHNIKDDTTLTYQINATVGNQKIDITAVNNDIIETESNVKKHKMLIIGAIVVIVVLIIIYLIKRHILRKNQEDDDDDDDENYSYDNYDNDYYNDEYSQEVEKSSASEELRNIGLFDNTEKEVFEQPEETKRSKRYKGKRFK